MRAWVVVVVAACGSTPRPPTPAPAPTVSSTYEPAVAEPWAPPPPARPEERSRDERIFEERQLVRRGAIADAAAVKRSDFLGPCINELLQSRPRDVRDRLGDALAPLMTTCDRSKLRATFAPLRGRRYTNTSYIGLGGELTSQGSRFELVIVRQGARPERITILAGSMRWTSPELDASADVPSLAVLPYTRTIARVIQAVLDSEEPIVRFESATGGEDIVVGEEMKADLRAVADIADLLSP